MSVVSGILDGKQIVVMGASNRRSIAWGCAKVMAEQGAKIIYTYRNARSKKHLSRLVGDDKPMVPCDVSDDENIKNAFAEIGKKYGKIDGVVHAIAYADPETLQSKLMDVKKPGYNLAQDISTYSFISVVHYASKIMNPKGSFITMTYMGATRAIPNYNMMGVAKAALEASVRYLARDLGPKEMRVNAISAGAVKTLSVTGIKHHRDLLNESEARTVDKKSVTIDEIGGAAAFLMSDLSTGVTGNVIFVDKGVHLLT